MFIVTMVKTADGKLHESEQAARTHVDKLYGNALGTLARTICRADGKYMATMEYIDANLQLFVDLSKIKADMQMTTGDDDDTPGF